MPPLDFDTEPVFFRTQAGLREWFEENYDKTTAVWIGYYKKSTGRESITWDESVEEAICFGWIDGIRKSIDDQCYKIRFTPRNPGSNWSLKNIATAEKMIKQGMMKPSGELAYKKKKDKRSGIYSFEQGNVVFSNNYERTFRKNGKAWEYFISEAPHYRKAVIHWVMSARQEKTRLSRLETLIRDSENGVRIKPMRRNEN